MKKICLTLFTFAAIASASRAAAATGNHFYLQASPLYAIPGKDLEAQSGIGLALGLFFDETQEIELGGTAFDTEFKSNNTATHTEQSEVQFKHLLATYRYVIPVRDDFRLFAGFSAGIARVSYEITTVDRNVIAGASPSYVGGANTTVSGRLFDGSSSSWRYSSPYTLPVYTYNPSDGTLTQRFSGSNTVAAGGPQLGFEYDMAQHSTIVISAKWLYMAKTDFTTSGGIAFVQAGYRYSF